MTWTPAPDFTINPGTLDLVRAAPPPGSTTYTSKSSGSRLQPSGGDSKSNSGKRRREQSSASSEQSSQTVKSRVKSEPIDQLDPIPGPSHRDPYAGVDPFHNYPPYSQNPAAMQNQPPNSTPPFPSGFAYPPYGSPYQPYMQPSPFTPPGYVHVSMNPHEAAEFWQWQAQRGKF